MYTVFVSGYQPQEMKMKIRHQVTYTDRGVQYETIIVRDRMLTYAGAQRIIRKEDIYRRNENDQAIPSEAIVTMIRTAIIK